MINMLARPGCAALTLAASLAIPALLSAQAAATPRPPMPAAAASSQGSAEVRLNGRYVGTQWFPPTTALAGPGVIRLDYGQPHARGRVVMGGELVPMDKVWRLGANLATHLTTDVPLDLGGLTLPAGRYTLFALPSASSWKLIVSRQTAQWGTAYDPSQDIGRVDLTVSKLNDPLESFTMWLIPNVSAADAPPAPASGVLAFAWERTKLSIPWKVVTP